MGLSFIGLVVVPGRGHAPGRQRRTGIRRPLAHGVFSHKNVAGPVIACWAFGGLSPAARLEKGRNSTFRGSSDDLPESTPAKTTAGLVPLSILIVMMPTLIGMRLLTPILMTIALVGFAAGTLGMVFIDVEGTRQWLVRPRLRRCTALWAYASQFIANVRGPGYEADFWVRRSSRRRIEVLR